MNIVAIKSDMPRAELYLISDGRIKKLSWEADRRLAKTLNTKIKTLLAKNDLTLSRLDGIAVFSGPGSFTGLRIGHSVANALAYSLEIPIVGVTGEHWLSAADTRLHKQENDHIALPKYGSPARVTKPKK
jgi:tRNA threonylcarbamoyladenosine biosynthesis protein TsaB